MSDTSFAPPQKFEFTVTQPEQTALALLAEGTGLSKQRIKDAMNKGAVWWTVKGKTLRLRRATKVLNKGTRLQFFYDEQVLARKPETASLLYDAGNYSIWFKPPGMLSQGSQWGDHCSILRWVEVNGQFTQGRERRDCFLVHRLDADASGLIMLAHDPQAAAKLSILFQARDMRKFYQAWVTGDADIAADGLVIDQPLDGKTAITRVTKTRVQDSCTLVDITIDTGRKHQIRRHLATLGHPIVGDRLYGRPASQGLQLRAYRLAFLCPFSQRPLEVTLPEDLQFQ